MKAVEAKLLDFLSGVKQFIVPIYQRTYSWRITQCEQLWKDIERVALDQSASAHFVGSVVYIQKGIYQSVSVPQLLVIDGQQRLTTITLLLTALARALETMDEAAPINPRKIMDYYLTNSLETGAFLYKLQLTKSDRETLTRLLQGKEPLERASRRILENFAFFEKQLRRPGLDLEQVFHGLHKLMIVDISLDHQHDNPQLIFESLNSTGLDLTQADLIRNYVLMGLEAREQEELYEEYWHPMEQAFDGGQGVFDRFMRDYLTLKTRNIPRLDQVYDGFKAFHRAAGQENIRAVVAEIHGFSKAYSRFVRPSLETDRAVRLALEDINALKMEVAYPFLLEVFADAAAGILTHEGLVEVLRMCEAFVLRRSACGVSSNSLNKFFSTLSVKLDKARYVESLGALFLRQKGINRFPRNDEFVREILVWDLYRTGRAAYVLRKLENHERKEPVDLNEFATIEHILPQNQKLSKPWREMLGSDWERVQDEWLDTLGNLTLTGYNSELSDRPFLEKRDMTGGFADSPLRLNRDLAKLEQWDETQIRQRGQHLATLALEVWREPVVSEALLRQVDTDAAVLDPVLRHFENASEQLLNLYLDIETGVTTLDPTIDVIGFKNVIAFRTWFKVLEVEVQPTHDRLRIYINAAFGDLDDPNHLLEQPKPGLEDRWARGYLTPLQGADAAIDLMRQALEMLVTDDSESDDDA
jgi:uncharacterized protein with ParB-like and HNH nuclease domain/predicted transport protein